MFARLLHFRRLGFALLLLAAAVLLRWPALDRKIWNLDEGSTITMAQLIRAGQVPLIDAADNRTPLVPYIKALILTVAGDWNTRAVHLSVALMLGLTAVLLWQIARQLGRESAGVFAALVFTCLSAGMLPDVDALTAHTGWFVIFFSSAGFWIFSHALPRFTRATALAAGLAFGLSHLAKQPGLLDFGVCLVLVLLLACLDRETRPRLGSFALLLLLGFLTPLAVTVAYYSYRGALDDLIFYAWTYNTKYYVPEVPLAERLWAIHMPFKLLLNRMPVLLVVGVAAAAGLLHAAFRGLRREAFAPKLLVWLILGWTASGLLSTTLSGRDFNHYSIQVMPGLSLACGWILAGLWRRAGAWRAAGKHGRGWAARVAVGVIIVSGVGSTLAALSKIDLSDGTELELGRLVQSQSRETDRIFIWGYMPELHVYARRLPSTRYIYTNWLTGMIPWTNLDWFKDTRYAIIPGSAENLRQDFERRPPAVVVDTDSRRGYLKYPLRRQEWLWHKVQTEFAEVEPERAHGWGFRVYRRLAAAPTGRLFPSRAPIDPRVRLKAEARIASQTTPVEVVYPAGTGSVELYKDGALYRRIECPSDRPGSVIFLAIAEDLPPGEYRLQAVAAGRQPLASAEHRLLVTPAGPLIPPGPALEFEDRAIPPLLATDRNGPLTLKPGGRDWNAHAPAQIVYERPPGLHSLDVEYGLDDILARQPEKWKTDGVEVAVHFENQAGENKVLFRRHLDARLFGADQGLQKQRVQLPLNEPGRITIWVSPGKESDASSDWAYLRAVRGVGSPASLWFRGRKFFSTRIDTPLGMAAFFEAGLDVLMVHAPSQIDFALRPGMYRLTATIGLLSTAWNGPKGSAGAVFEVWHVPPQGDPKLLRSQLVDPRHNPTHRGHQTISVLLPQVAGGVVRLATRPAHPQDNAFNYTYWGAIAVEAFPAAIATPGKPVLNSDIEARFGYDTMEEGLETVWFMHAPARMAFNLPGGLRQLSGKMGLLNRAYTGPERTEGASFIVEFEDAAGHLTTVLTRDLNPQDVPADRGFVPFAVTLPTGGPGRLILRTDARPGHGITRAWTFWHALRLDP